MSLSTDDTSRKPGPSVRRIPPGDDRERLICPDCGYIAYDNPRIVVGSVVVDSGDRLLLCRRAIEPRRGFWTIPAGFLELNETATAGAVREAWEEARAKIAIDGLLAVYDIPRISQVQLIFRAALSSDSVAAGPESAEVALFDWQAVPWDALAFPSVHWSLGHYRQSAGRPLSAPFTAPEDGALR